MDKFMPKTIEQLNAEFEARMEKAKQDELNAAAEKAANIPSLFPNSRTKTSTISRWGICTPIGKPRSTRAVSPATPDV